jgi:hypothetical protein
MAARVPGVRAQSNPDDGNRAAPVEAERRGAGWDVRQIDVGLDTRWHPLDLRGDHQRQFTHPIAVAVEAIRRPAQRRRQVEFDIGLVAVGLPKELEARRFPECVGTRRRYRRGQTQRIGAVDGEGQQDIVSIRCGPFDPDTAHRSRRSVRMT